MRFRGLAFTAAVFSLPLSAFAQHTAAPAPHVTPTVSHISAPSAAVHPASVPSVRMSGAPASAPRIRTSASTVHAPKGPIGRETPRSATNAGPEKRSFFSLFRKRVPHPESPKSKGSRCSTGPAAASGSSSVARNGMVPPSPPEARHGCTVVPVPTPGVPCNVLSPCCP